MRAGAPGRRGSRLLGALPLWRNDDDRWLALEALERDALAASTREAMEAKLRTIRRALAGWGLEPFPPVHVDGEGAWRDAKGGWLPLGSVVPLVV